VMLGAPAEARTDFEPPPGGAEDPFASLPSEEEDIPF